MLRLDLTATVPTYVFIFCVLYLQTIQKGREKQYSPYTHQTMQEKKPDLRTSPRAIWQLSWPQIVMMYFIFFIGLTDIWTAGRINGSTQAALGMISQVTLFLQVLAMAVSSGAMAAISQSMGAQKMRRARRYIAMTLLLVTGLGLLVALVAGSVPAFALRMVMLPESLLPLATSLWAVAMLTLPGNYIFSCTGVLFRATRQVMLPLWTGAAGCLLNLLGNLGFGLGYFGLPAYGAMGIIWTSFVCIWVCALGNCALLVYAGYLNKRDLPLWRWVKRGAPYLLKVARDAGAAQVVWQTGYLTLYVVVASLPTENITALAGLTAGLRIEAFLFMPAIALNMSAAVLVGNSLGEGKPEQAKRLGLLLTGYGTLAMCLVAALLWPFRQELAASLTTEPAVQAQTFSYLSYNLLATPFSVASTIMGGIMVGAGATRYNLLVYGSTFWLVRLPLAFVLGHYVWQSSSGVFVAMLFSQSLQACTMFIVVCKGTWARFAIKATSFHA
jgi:multidrug resistance protein, MATE family